MDDKTPSRTKQQCIKGSGGSMEPIMGSMGELLSAILRLLILFVFEFLHLDFFYCH